MRKIIFFDIDGTIVTDAAVGESGIIPESAGRAIASARRSGNLCFINSGRPYKNIDKDVLAIGFDGVISGCGTDIRVGDKVIFSHKLEKSVCGEILEACKTCRVNGFFERSDKNFFIKCGPSDGWIYDFIEKVRNNGTTVSFNTDDEDFSFDKMCVFDDEKSDIEGFLKTAGEYFSIIDRGSHFHELVPKGCSKGIAMGIVAKYFNIPKEDTYAIGDSENDIEMFQNTPHSIGMGNGKSIHKFVSYVTADIMDDGLEKALAHFKLTKE